MSKQKLTQPFSHSPPPIPYSLFLIPYSLFLIPCSLFPIPYSLFPIPYLTALPKHHNFAPQKNSHLKINNIKRLSKFTPIITCIPLKYFVSLHDQRVKASHMLADAIDNQICYI